MVQLISMCLLVPTLSWPASASSPSPSPVYYWSTPYDKVWGHTECTQAGEFDDVTLEQCESHCEKSEGCNTVNHPLGQCQLRACASPVPQPSHASSEGFVGYKYLGNSKWSTMYKNIWDHEQCPIVSPHGVKNDVTLGDCQSMCKDTSKNYHCTAVNFQAYGGCVMHACGSPIPTPTWSEDPKHGRKWAGYARLSHPSWGTGVWQNVASASSDISYELTTGLSWSDSSTVTKTDQLSLSNALETDVWFFKDTITTTYTHTYAKAVMKSNTTTVTDACQATCEYSNLPKGYYTWTIWQWTVSAKMAQKYIGMQTCHFQCIPEVGFKQGPLCPQGCCEGQFCQACVKGCLKNATAVLV